MFKINVKSINYLYCKTPPDLFDLILFSTKKLMTNHYFVVGSILNLRESL